MPRGSGLEVNFIYDTYGKPGNLRVDGRADNA
jgi:hypothetical protein